MSISITERRRHAAGFTLLEVLVALVVLALALVALTRTAANETQTYDAVRERAVAGWVAANALTEARLEPGLPAVGRRSGTTQMASRAWRYTLDVSSTPSSGIRRLHLAVFAPADADQPDATPLLVMDGFVGRQLQL